MGANSSISNGRRRLTSTMRVARGRKTIDSDESNEKVFRILLLGASGSGKSTLLKQMKIIFGKGFDGDEMEKYRKLIQKSLLDQMVVLLMALKRYNIHLKSTFSVRHILSVHNQNERDPYSPGLCFSAMTVNALQQLWEEPELKTLAKRGREFGLNESAAYFFDNIERITKSDYQPGQQDILYSRVKTTGIVELPMRIKGKNFLALDVGGQRSERRKWINHFDNVDALLFMVAMNEFDQNVVAEDEEGGENKTPKNCITDALEVFESVVNLKIFEKTSMIIYLNKQDLFKEKVNKGLTIQSTFPNYHGPTGPGSHEQQADYMIDRFIAQNKDQRKYIYTHQGGIHPENNFRISFCV